MQENYFKNLNDISTNGMTEDKKVVSKSGNGTRTLTYLSWAHAWKQLKLRYPDANYKIYENERGWPYFTDGKTGWVKVDVTIQSKTDGEITHTEYLPIMDFASNSIPVDNITSRDVSDAIQRAVTKGIARHGLGLDLYMKEKTYEPADPAAKNTPPAKQIYGNSRAPKTEKGEAFLKNLNEQAVNK